MMVLLLIPLCGIMALGGEASFWFMTQRALQNAADSAALAAATNNDAINDSNGLPRYRNEALAVAKTYGFPTGVNNITVTPVANQPCPGSTDTNCYKVTIRRDVPLYLSQVVGYQGDAVHSGRYAKIVMTEAIAKPSSQVDACLIALGFPPTKGISLSGSSTGFSACDVVSNSEVKCSSVDLGTIYAPSVQACGGETFIPSTETYADPYAGFGWSGKIPTTCGSTKLSSVSNWASPVVICSSANATLAANVNITTANAVIVIRDQTIDLNGFNITTTGSGSVTIIFSGAGVTLNKTWFDNSKNTPSVVQIKAPNTSSATFRNFSIVQDPKFTSATDFNPKSNDKWTLNVLGLIYAPDTSISLNGSVNSSIGGLSCISIIAKYFSSNGGKLQNNPVSGCAAAGLELPGLPGQRAGLVQ